MRLRLAFKLILKLKTTVENNSEVTKLQTISTDRKIHQYLTQ